MEEIEESPVFLIPRERTGGTLLATILGTHSRLSFGYELYPDRLEDAGSGRPYRMSELNEFLAGSRRTDEEMWVREMPRNNFRTFCARVRRCGVSMEELCRILQDFEPQDLGTIDLRLDLIERILRFQMVKCGKERWGSKMRVNPELLRRRHPRAVFLMMLRDGRDVLDSRLKVGNFQTNAGKVAEDWVDSLTHFDRFLAASGARGMLVKYEDLVCQPGDVLRQVCDVCGLSFEKQMLAYETCELSLLRSPHGHLSAQQISQGLNSASVGRYRVGLSKRQLREFEEIAGATLRRFGYLDAECERKEAN